MEENKMANGEIDFSRPLSQDTLIAPPPEPEVVEAAVPTVAPIFDLATVKLALAPYKSHIDKMMQKAKAIQVNDEISQVLAVEIGTSARKLKNQVENLRKSTVQPLNDHVRDVNNLAKSFIDPLDSAERDLKAKISTYQTQLRIEQQRREAAAREAARKQQERIDAEQRVIREEAARKAREAEEALKKETDEAARLALQRTIDEETEAANAPPQVAVAPVIPEIPRAVRANSGSAHQKKRWVCRIVDPAEVPRQYCAPIQTLLNEAVKSGMRNIAGCVIEEISETTFR
jgi:hypothetical protein